jgi:glycosyltransferase involved in cell wall biosynthesis
MPPVRVLHVSQPTTAGVPRVVADLAADQVRRGWEVVVASPTDGHLALDVRAAGAEHLPWAATRSPTPTTAREALALRAVVARTRPDLVHLHSAKAGLAGRLVLRGRLPTVFQPHAWSFLAVDGPVRVATVAWERAAARWCDALAVVSEDERSAGEHVGVRGRWALVPNGVDLSVRRAAGVTERDSARARLGLGGEPLAVCVGRLSRQKGQDCLLRAWPTVRATVPAARLVLVGDGPDRSALSALTSDGVDLVGAVETPDDWLAAADVVVLPSRWEAGLSLAAMEAMAAGRSIVATRVAGVQDCLPGDAGQVVDVDDGPGLARAMVQRLLDPDLAQREGRAARAAVEQRYDLAVTTARVAELYGSVITSRCGAPPC